ncbi:MAG: HD domain-containing protein [Desulfuromonadales bacterium]|nr:HD domain-containing protein [Desulfuromonadales bacterium]
MTVSQHDNLQKLIKLLTTAAANASLYHSEHRQVIRLCRQALNELQLLFNTHSDVTLKVIEGQLIFDNKPVVENLSVNRLLESLNRNGISFLKIATDVYAEELLGLINILSKNPDKQIAVKDSENIHFGQVEIRFTRSDQHQLASWDFTEIATHEADRFMDIYQTVRSKQKLEMTGINEIVNGFVNAFNCQSDAFMAIAPLRAMDEYTYTHSTNICMLNLAQAKALGIAGQLLNDIGIAAMLHDIGKMFISPDILSKSEQLDDAEWQIMQQHPRLGAEYLLNTPGVPRLAVVTAFEHHMRYDNSGYPQAANSWQQHICSHMTAISDTYDAMRTNRAYEESLDTDQILAIMLELAGNKLHPRLTYNFLQIISERDKDTEPSNYTTL